MPNNKDITLFIDPVSHHFHNDVLFDINYASLNGDNILAPYVFLREWFTSRGIRVHTADRLLKGEGISSKNIYISLGIRNRYPSLIHRDDVILSGFFALECPIVEPDLYEKLPKLQKYFKRIFSFSDCESLKAFTHSSVSCQQFRIPQSFDAVHEQIWRQGDRNFLVMINANKLPCIYIHELYTERLRAIEYFSQTSEIDLYGVGWNGPAFKLGKTIIPATIRRMQRSLAHQWLRLFPDPLLTAVRRVYKGPASSKAETLGKYTFAVCFENMILKGWITEKIFDCFFTGTIPIYLGEPEIEKYIPSECFIDMRRFSDYEGLKKYLKSLTKKEIRSYKEHARDFLTSPLFRPFTKESFVDMFRRIVEEDGEIQIQ